MYTFMSIKKHIAANDKSMCCDIFIKKRVFTVTKIKKILKMQKF